MAGVKYMPCDISSPTLTNPKGRRTIPFSEVTTPNYHEDHRFTTATCRMLETLSKKMIQRNTYRTSGVALLDVTISTGDRPIALT